MSVISKALERNRRESGVDDAGMDSPPTPASVVISSKPARRSGAGAGVGLALPGMSGRKNSMGLLMGALALAGVVAGYLLGRDAAPVKRAAPPSQLEPGPAAPAAGAPVAVAAAPIPEPAATPAETPAPKETPITVRVEVSLAQPAPVAGTPLPLPDRDYGVLMDEPIEPVYEEMDEPELTPEPTPRRARRPAPQPTLGPPSLSPAEVMSIYKLQGVFFTEGDSSALINGEVVSEGTVLDDIIVLKITKNSVEIEYEGRKYTLK